MSPPGLIVPDIAARVCYILRMHQSSHQSALKQSAAVSMRFRLPLVLVTCFLIGCSKPPESGPTVTPRVKVFAVGKEATGQSRRISGTVVAADRSTLSFGVGGKIVEVIAKQGQAVTEGQLLARLDDEPFQLKLEEARAGLNNARWG